jgi:hypothetical protein
VLATTVDAAVCPDGDILQAYQDQNATVEPGFRWIKNPAAISPVWLEKLGIVSIPLFLRTSG